MRLAPWVLLQGKIALQEEVQLHRIPFTLCLQDLLSHLHNAGQTSNKLVMFGSMGVHITPTENTVVNSEQQHCNCSWAACTEQAHEAALHALKASHSPHRCSAVKRGKRKVIEQVTSRLFLGAHLEGKHELVALKQAEAGVVVHVKGQSLHDVAQASLQAGRLQSHKNHRTTV